MRELAGAIGENLVRFDEAKPKIRYFSLALRKMN